MTPNIYLKQQQGFGDNLIFAGKDHLAILPPKNGLVIQASTHPKNVLAPGLQHHTGYERKWNRVDVLVECNFMKFSSITMKIPNTDAIPEPAPFGPSGPHLVGLLLRKSGYPRSHTHKSLLEPHQISQNLLDQLVSIHILSKDIYYAGLRPQKLPWKQKQ